MTNDDKLRRLREKCVEMHESSNNLRVISGVGWVIDEIDRLLNEPPSPAPAAAPSEVAASIVRAVSERPYCSALEDDPDELTVSRSDLVDIIMNRWPTPPNEAEIAAWRRRMCNVAVMDVKNSVAIELGELAEEGVAIMRRAATAPAASPSEAPIRAWAIKSDECDGYCNVLGTVAWDSKGLATAQHRYQNERVVEVELREVGAATAPATSPSEGEVDEREATRFSQLISHLDHLSSGYGQSVGCNDGHEESWRKDRDHAHEKLTREVRKLLMRRAATAPAASPPVTSEAATHRCKVCGALWRLNPADNSYPKPTWSVVSKEFGKCCDNVGMGEQIEKLPPVTSEAREDEA